MKYKRVLLKLSGEALMGEEGYGIDPKKLQLYAKEILPVHQSGVQIAVVLGGGNIYRGLNSVNTGIERVQGDYMGMLATVINSLALQAVLENMGLDTRVMTAVNMDEIAEPYIRRRAIRHMEKGRIVIICGGTSNPFFTTDSAAALRANEVEAQLVLKGTKVDGIYDSDPAINPDAVKYDKLSFQEVISKQLKVMDMTAFTLCAENSIPIRVFDINQKGHLERILQGESLGTIVE